MLRFAESNSKILYTTSPKWNVQSGECLAILRVPRPYEGVNITEVTGLTEAQKASLIALGAIESE